MIVRKCSVEANNLQEWKCGMLWCVVFQCKMHSVASRYMTASVFAACSDITGSGDTVAFKLNGKDKYTNMHDAIM